MAVTLLRCNPQAPRLVRIAALLILTGSVLEAFWMFGSRWPEAQGRLELWRATVSPVIVVCLSFLLADALERLVRCVYWLTILLWVPAVLLSVLLMLSTMFPPPSANVNLAGYAAGCCYAAAALLLVTKGSRHAFKGDTLGAPGRVT